MENHLPAGIYIHVPFCTVKCPYCDFYSLPFDEALADRYTQAVLRAIDPHPYGALEADTLYFGGGTPSLLGPRRLEAIIQKARDAFCPSGNWEVTAEANPGIPREALAAMRGAGLNRLSFGVQSLREAELTHLGRRHTAEEARQSLLDAAAAGFDNLSADLMLAIPGQTRQSLADSIDELATLPIAHLSAYLLKVEEDTPFGKMDLSLPDDDLTAQLYQDTVERLAGHGFQQYEISNFARDGRVSRHNFKYWRCAPYLGIGPGAHSFLGGRRFYFPRELDRFLEAPAPFSLTVDDGQGGGLEERLMLGLRLCEGIRPDQLPLTGQQKKALYEKARLLESHGLIHIEDQTIALTTTGFLLSNSVTVQLLEAIDPECS